MLVSQEMHIGMSCSVCAGYSSYNCPCCGEDVRMMECPDCEGEGFHYYAFDTQHRRFKKVAELAFTILPADEDVARSLGLRWCQGIVKKCPTCKGEGEIPEDY